MGGVEKPLLRVCGETLLERLASRLTRLCRLVVVAVSPYTRRVARLAGRLGLEVVETSGAGYVEDLSMLLRALRPRPLLVAPGDLYAKDDCLEALVAEALRLDADIVTFVSRGEPLGLSVFNRDEGGWVDLEADCLRDIDDWASYREVVEECSRGFTVGGRRPES